MMILTFALFVLGRLAELEHFTGKDIRIFSATANHIYLVKDTKDGHIMPKSKFSNLDGIFSSFKILNDGQEYRLFSGDEMLCAALGTVSKCENTGTWVLTPMAMGFTLSQGGKCITIASRTRIGVTQCTDSDDQVFDFKLANEDESCGEEKKPEEPKQEPKTIVINVSTNDLVEKKPNETVNAVKSSLFHHCEDSSDSHDADFHPNSYHLKEMLAGSKNRSTFRKIVYL